MLREASYTPSRDLAAGGGMPVAELEALVDDIRLQPEWRTASNIACQYYDGHQLTASRIAQMEAAGQPVSITNLLARAINGALGMEAKARLDWKVTSDDDGFMDVASVVNAKLSQAQRETNADMAISDAYKSQLVAGIGWVEVSRDPDPLNFPYRVQEVHRNEVWWDWRAKRKDLRDARWLCRQRWVDLDEAINAYPKFKAELQWCLTDGPLNDALRLTVGNFDAMERMYQLRDGFRVPRDEWMDTGRRRVRMYEVWYRVPVKVTVIEDNDGNRVRFNPQNPIHQIALQRGVGRLITGPSYIIRKAIFAGPYRLTDVATARRYFPYIPFWCYRQDDDRTPYGIAQGMLSPQEEYNERRSKLLWLLRTAQVFVDDDALATKYNNFVDLAEQIMRPDAVVVMNATRKNAQGLRVEHNMALAREQVDVMTDAKQLIQEQPGIFSTMLGDAPAGVTSGLAINSLVEQSVVALGETNDNFRLGRRMAGEALADLIIEDMQRPNMRAKIGSGKKARVVVLNAFGENGEPINQVAAAPLKTGLQDVPSTPAHRMQQQQQLASVIQAMGANPAAMAVLAPAFIETTDIPNKEAYAEWMRKQAGVPDPDDQAEEGANPSDQAAQAAQAMQAQAAQLELAERAAKVKETEAKAAKTLTDADLNQARIAEIIDRLAQPQQQQVAIEDALAEAGA